MSAGRTSWRDSRQRQTTHVVSQKRRRKFGVALALLACLALFTWLILPKTVPPQAWTRLIPIIADRSNSPLIPNLSYALAAQFPAESPRLKINAHNTPESEMLGRFNVPDEKDDQFPPAALIVFIRCEGISQDGRPLVICNNFAETSGPLHAGQTGTVDFKVFLEAAQHSRAPVKLIICDYGRTNIVPDLGLFTNQFATIIEDDVHRLEDDSTYVLLSHAPLQLSFLQHSGEGTVFANAVTDVLLKPWEYRSSGGSGPADELTLREFVEAVQGRCGAQCKDGVAQTPPLFRGHRGAITAKDIPQQFLLAAAKPEEPAADSAPDGQAPAAPAKTALRQAARSRSVESQMALATVVPLGSSATRNLESRPFMVKATDQRRAGRNDVLAQATAVTAPPAAAPSPTAGTNPSDTHPPSQAGAVQPGDAPAAAEAPPADAAAPPAASDSKDSAPPASGTAAILAKPKFNDQIPAEEIRAWAAYQALRQRDDQSHVTPIDFAPQEFRRLENRLCRLDFDLWTSRNDGARHDMHLAALNDIADQLEKLRAAMSDRGVPRAGQRSKDPFQAAWDKFRESSPAGLARLETEFQKSPAAPAIWGRGQDLLFRLPDYVDWFDMFSQTRTSSPPEFKDLKDLFDKCGRLGWSGWSKADGMSPDDISAMNAKVRECERIQQRLIEKLSAEADDLLQSLRSKAPLTVDTGRRAEVLLSTPLLNIDQRHELLGRLLAAEDKKQEFEPVIPVIDSRPWHADRAKERAELHARLISAICARPELAVSELDAFGGVWVAEVKDVRGEYQRQPDQLATLALDLSGLPLAFPSVSIVAPVESERLELTVTEPSEVRLQRPVGSRLVWTPVTLRLSRSGVASGPVEVGIDNSVPEGIDLRLVDHDPDSPRIRTITDSGNLTLDIRLEIAAQGPVTRWGAVPVRIYARSNSAAAASSVPVLRPTRNTIALLHHDALRSERETIRIFPQGRTPLILGATNEAGRDVELQFDLLRSPVPLPADGSTDWNNLQTKLVDFETRQLTVQGQLSRMLTATQKLTADAHDVSIELGLPQPPAPPEGAVAPPAPATPPTVPAPRPDLTNGLICVVRESAPPAGIDPVMMVFRLPILPLHPLQYLNASATYDERARQIQVTISRKRDAADKRPITVRISNADEFPGQKDTIATLEEESARLFVSADVSPAERRVELEVDGYPRAFQFNVRCLGGQPPISPNTDVLSIRIRRLTVVDKPWEFAIQGPDVVVPQPNALLSKEVLKAAEGQGLAASDRLPFAVFESSPTLMVVADIAADVPGDLNAKISVGRDGAPPLPPRLFDRERLVVLDRVEANGALSIDCTMSDLKFEIPMAGLNGEALVTASLQYARADQNRNSTSTTRVRIDGSPPQVTELTIADENRRPPAGGIRENSASPAVVWVQADDGAAGSGVVSVEFKIGQQFQDLTDVKPRYGRPLEDQQTWMLPLGGLLKDLVVGQTYQVEVVARDRLNHESEAKYTTFRVAPPAPPAGDKPPPAADKGVVAGKVLLGSKARSGVDVELLENGKAVKKTKSDAGGTFRFTDLTGSAYQIKASTFAVGNKYEAQLDAIKPDPSSQEPTIHELELVVEKK